MKSKSVIILPVICAVSAILLSLVNLITEPKITAYENDLAISAVKEVANGNDFSEKIEVSDNQYISYYYKMLKNNQTIGYILGLKTSGYGGEMTLVSSIDTDGKILSIKMLSNNETPGVGKKSENDGYMDMFIGTGLSNNPIPVKKDMLSSDNQLLVSGATLTFSGISKALNVASEFVKQL